MEQSVDIVAAPKNEAAAVPAEVLTAPAGQPESAKKKHRTVGNIIYDFGVFGSVAWAGVAILSALSAHEAMHGNNKLFGWLRSLNDNVTSGLKKGLSKTILKNASEKTVEGYAKGTTMFLTLGMGGNALMAPIKWLEDNRQKNAARIDKALGTTPPDPETIAHEPKQTWKSVFSGRLFSWGMSYVAFLALGPKHTDNIQNWFGEKATKGWMKLRPSSNPDKVKRWANIAAFDALFTMITATLTYALSRYIAKKDDHPTIGDDLYIMNTSASRVFAPTEASSVANPHHYTQSIKKEVKPAKANPSSFAEKINNEPAADLARV